jgi:hypothetical protein
VLILSRVRQAELYAHRALLVLRPQPEGVIAQVLAALDVVLIAVSPVELDLLTLIRNGINSRFVDTLRKEVAI